MKIINNLTDLRQWRSELYQSNAKVAFVPTMGNLHEGHIKLVTEAKKSADVVITSIFVNPMQFGENEDLDAYPRTFDADCEKLQAAGNDVVFFPTVNDVYPNGLAAQTVVSVPHNDDMLCGEATQRPGHFDGVATVVTKLFNMVAPDMAFFGEKDYQQLSLIHTLVADLNLPIQIIGVPTVREQNGLAKSSRNGYLTAEQKQQAGAIYQSLSAVCEALAQGQRDISVLKRQALSSIEEAGLKPDYVEIREHLTLAPLTPTSTKAVVLAAAFLGKARLIDNMTIELG